MIKSDPTQVLKDFQPSKEFFIGIDSVGFVCDSMEIKRIVREFMACQPDRPSWEQVAD